MDLWRFLLRFGSSPHEHLLALAAKYGDIVQLAFPGELVVLLAKPEYIEHVLHHKHQNYDKQTARYENARQIWGTNLLTADGDVWRRQRQRMQPAFHQEAVRRFAGMVAEEAQKICSSWARSAGRGESRDVYPDMLAITVRAISRASFGAAIEDQVERVERALDDLHDYINPMAPLNLLRVPHSVQRFINPEYRRFHRSYKVLHGIFDTMVADRLRDGESGQTDLLGLMMAARDDETSKQMTPAQLHDEMMGILMAGHETTGIAVSWCWYWLSRNPEIERSFHAELDAVLDGRPPTFDDLASLPYTQWVLQEALRICPSVWGMDRRAREADEIDGYVIPRGAKVAFSPYVMHHLPQVPGTIPRRSIRAGFHPSAPRHGRSNAYLPFGGGPRRCVGMRFAQLEGQLMLSILGQSFAVRPKPGAETRPRARLNLQPSPGVELLLHARQARPALQD